MHAFNEIRTVLNVDGNLSIGASLTEFSRGTLYRSEILNVERIREIPVLIAH